MDLAQTLRPKPVLGLLLLASLACAGPPDVAEPPPPSEACIADSLGALRNPESVPDCAKPDATCEARCGAGSADHCLGLAYIAEKNSSKAAEAGRLYQRACRLGSTNACTNYAAGIWVRDHTQAELDCALRTFEKICEARDHFACGMVGRERLNRAKTGEDFAATRQYLEQACENVGGFSCRVLARHLESGELGSYEPGQIPALLARACEGGDPDGCGEPRTAAETFR